MCWSKRGIADSDFAGATEGSGARVGQVRGLREGRVERATGCNLPRAMDGNGRCLLSVDWKEVVEGWGDAASRHEGAEARFNRKCDRMATVQRSCQ